jgi:hypothetical protein
MGKPGRAQCCAPRWALRAGLLGLLLVAASAPAKEVLVARFRDPQSGGRWQCKYDNGSVLSIGNCRGADARRHRHRKPPHPAGRLSTRPKPQPMPASIGRARSATGSPA